MSNPNYMMEILSNVVDAFFLGSTWKALTYTSTLDIPCSMLVLSAVEGSNIQIILTLIPCCPDPHPLLSWFPIRLSPLLACWLGFVGFGTWNLVDFV